MIMHDDELYPADVAPMARKLDELAETDRQAAAGGLERRIARASWRRRSALRLGHTTRRPWLTKPSMALAASVAVLAGGAAAWLAIQPPQEAAPARASLEQEVDVWLTLAGPDDGLRAEIEALRLLNEDLAQGLEPGWFEDELSGESL